MPPHAQPPHSATFHPSDPVAVNELRAPTITRRSVPIDAVVLILLIGVANYFLAKSDPGWMGLNPTPWLLVPVYLGARHGLVGGILGPVLAIGAILGLKFYLSDSSPLADLKENAAFFTGLLGIGIVAGTAHKIVTGHLRRVQDYALASGRDNLRLAEEVALLRENEASLQESLLLHGAEYTALTEELARLFSTSESELEPGLLALFHQHLGVTASAIFVDDSDSEGFLLSTSRGAEDLIPQNLTALDPRESRMISAALSTGKIVAASHMLDDPDAGQSEPLLAVIPWGDGPGKIDAICVIYRMAFDRVNWETLGRIEAVFDWAMARRSAQSETKPAHSDSPHSPGQILGPATFRRRIHRARSASESLNLSSRLIIFSPKSDQLAPAEQTRFVDELRESIRNTDTLGGMISLRGDYAIGLLTQLSTDKAAELYAARLLELAAVEGVKYEVYDLFDAALEASLREAEEREANPIAKSAKQKDQPPKSETATPKEAEKPVSEPAVS